MPTFIVNGNTFNPRHIVRLSEPRTMNQTMPIATFTIFTVDGQKFETRFNTLDDANNAHGTLAALMDDA